jgi:hypothetical protein
MVGGRLRIRQGIELCVPALLIACVSGCAALYRTQLSDVEPPNRAKHISVKVSETTLDFKEMASLAKLGGRAFHSPAATNVGRGLQAYTTLFQLGPWTGAPVFNELYARYIPELLREKCPKGRVANIISIRESREYPVVKGQIVRIEADCFH